MPARAVGDPDANLFNLDCYFLLNLNRNVDRHNDCDRDRHWRDLDRDYIGHRHSDLDGYLHSHYGPDYHRNPDTKFHRNQYADRQPNHYNADAYAEPEPYGFAQPESDADAGTESLWDTRIYRPLTG